MKNDPAHLVPKTLGGPKALAKLLDMSVSAIYRWGFPKAKGGTEGHVPSAHIFRVWCALLEQGSTLSLEEVVFTEEERAQISDLRKRLADRAAAAPLVDTPNIGGAS